MLSDDELVEQILLGNENEAEELIKRYYTSILRYCRWHCSNLEKAEDLTQETFLKHYEPCFVLFAYCIPSLLQSLQN